MVGPSCCRRSRRAQRRGASVDELERLADAMLADEVVVVALPDEAGMVGTRDLARLADAAAQVQAKLVLVGDNRQLPEIQAGGAFHALAERLPAAD